MAVTIVWGQILQHLKSNWKMLAWKYFPQLNTGNWGHKQKKANTSFADRQLSLTTIAIRILIIKPLACRIPAGFPLFMSVTLLATTSLISSDCIPPSHTQDRALGARYTHQSVEQLSHWHTRQPISGSVEDGCHGSTSWAMLPHDLRCDATEPAPFLFCAAACMPLYGNSRMVQSTHTSPPTSLLPCRMKNKPFCYEDISLFTNTSIY